MVNAVAAGSLGCLNRVNEQPAVRLNSLILPRSYSPRASSAPLFLASKYAAMTAPTAL